MDMQFELPVVSVQEVPTLKKYLQQRAGQKLRAKYLVVKVWFPNKFPYLSLVTEDFKVSIAEDSPLFKPVLDAVKHCIAEELSFSIQLNTDNPSIYNLTTSSEKGSWTELGTTGHEFVIKTGRIRKS